MNLKFINSILLVTLFFDSIQSKCISNKTIETTGMPLTVGIVVITTTILLGMTCPGPFKIKSNVILNQRAIADFKIAKISNIKLHAFSPLFALCACADKCQYTTNCMYFESNLNRSGYYDCFLYKFNTAITQKLKNNLQRGIYDAQLDNMACGLPNILFK
jgi:hypothetical protein